MNMSYIEIYGVLDALAEILGHRRTPRISKKGMKKGSDRLDLFVGQLKTEKGGLRV